MKVNGKDHPIYEMENKIHVWNRQPENKFVICSIVIISTLSLVVTITMINRQNIRNGKNNKSNNEKHSSGNNIHNNETYFYY